MRSGCVSLVTLLCTSKESNSPSEGEIKLAEPGNKTVNKQSLICIPTQSVETLKLDRFAMVRAMQAETDYKQRMEPAAIIEILKTLSEEK